VVYDAVNPNRIIATFFHEGAVFSIDKKSGKAIKVLDGLTNPHGGRRLGEETYMATSTKSGEVVIGNLDYQERYNFSHLKGKPGFLQDFEWVQNSIALDDNIVSIDSNRNMLVIYNPGKQLIDFVPYDKNWAVQDIIPCRPSAKLFSQIQGLDYPSD
jgi:hypothetical protein